MGVSLSATTCRYLNMQFYYVPTKTLEKWAPYSKSNFLGTEYIAGDLPFVLLARAF